MAQAAPASLGHIAQTGFANGAGYDRGRPAYSPTAVQTLLEQLRVSGRQGAQILDLGAGTGKFTEALASRPEEYEIVAVEPHSEMREVLASKKLPRTKVLHGLGEKVPLEDESVDAVICAQCFHWFANWDSLQELHRVLRPHGVLGLIWNIDSYNTLEGESPTPRTAWEETAKEVFLSYDDEQPRVRHGKWREVFDKQSKSTPLSLIIPSDQLFSLPLGEETEEWTVKLPKDKAWERLDTYSNIAVLEADEKKRLKEKLNSSIDGDEEALDGDGNVILHGYTLMAWTTKIPTEGRAGLTNVERPGT